MLKRTEVLAVKETYQGSLFVILERFKGLFNGTLLVNCLQDLKEYTCCYEYSKSSAA